MSFQVRKLKEEKPKRSLPWKPILLNMLEFGRPALHWYGDWKARSEKQKRKKKRVHVLKRTLVVLIAIFIALFILAGVAKALLSIRILSFSTIASITGTAPPSDNNGFTNLLLLGQGDGDHDGQDLTDTIIVASIDPKETKSAVLLSLPRDLHFLSTEKMGKGKLNTFYRDYKGYLKYLEGMDEENASIEAIRELGVEVGRKLELPIHGVIKVDFIAFTEAVDRIEGVDIDVPYDIIDEKYPDENFGYDPFTILKGAQHLDGATALKYARSRSTTSDFDRSARQQQLLQAIAQKVKEEKLYRDAGAIIDFMKIFSENVETTLNLRELVGLADVAKDMDPSRVIAMQLSDRNALYDSFIEPGGFLYTPPRNLFDGASVLLPVSIPEFPVTWKQPRTFKKLLFETRSVYLANPVLSVLNAGAKSGIARKLATELTRYGFKVDVIANASMPKQEETFITTASEEDYNLALFFTSLFGINSQELPAELPADEVRQVTIVLGKNFEYRPLQDLILPSE